MRIQEERPTLVLGLRGCFVGDEGSRDRMRGLFELGAFGDVVDRRVRQRQELSVSPVSLSDLLSAAAAHARRVSHPEVE